ncbi:MAG: hypothetical protein ACOH15_05720 [Acetobacterium sp.]
MEAMSLTASKLQGPATTITKHVEDIRVKTTKEGNSSQNSVNEANSYNKYDTLELSQDYLEFKTKSENSVVTSDSNQLNVTINQMFRAKSSQNGVDAESGVNDTQTASPYTANIESEAISSVQLSSYTSSELKSLVQEGKITAAAYYDEVNSRQADEETPIQPEVKKALVAQKNISIVEQG